MSRLIWQAVRVAAAVALVVVPFGYAITGVHRDVWMGVGCGLAIGLGVGLRGGARAGPWMGILIGSIVGIVTALITGLVPGNGVGILVPPVLALAVGLIDGLRESSLRGYRDMSRETFIVALLLAVGLLPLVDAPADLRFNLAPLMCTPWIALFAGLLSYRRVGWRDARPPRLLILSAAATLALLLFLMVSEWMALGRIELGREIPGVLVLRFVSLDILRLVGVTAAAFLLGRVAITWLQPRLRVYGHLADYLRVMWVPIGGFAIGYLTIIVLFAGFYGMLEHFSPGAFAGARAGIIEWLSFAFFAALGQDFATVAPVSVGARALVGVHLMLSAGWVVVLFAAVMTSIGPKLDRIARHHADDASD